jgi:anti-sigma regulatory factor (Ser/Thr protein kinase)
MRYARFQVSENSQRGEARRAAAAAAHALGFDEETAGRVALVVSELAGNLVKHVPGGGELLLRSVARNGGQAIEIVTVDQGPGLGDDQRALRDGFSTAGSSGTGLGAVARLSDRFDLYTSTDLLPVARSTPGAVTIVLDLVEPWPPCAPEADPDERSSLSLLLAGRPKRPQG